MGVVLLCERSHLFEKEGFHVARGSNIPSIAIATTSELHSTARRRHSEHDRPSLAQKRGVSLSMFGRARRAEHVDKGFMIAFSGFFGLFLLLPIRGASVSVDIS